LGGILLVASLYTMLWGKSKEDKTDDATDDIEKCGEDNKSAESCPGEQQRQRTTATAAEVKESTLIGSADLRVQEH
jgi:hypothetical protein